MGDDIGGIGADALVEALIDAGTRRQLQPGDSLCREHDESNEAYVVIDGTIEALVAGHGGPMSVASHGPGAIVGEVTTLIGGHRTATLTATSAATVAVVTRADLSELFDRHPDEAAEVLRAARERTDRSRVAALLSQELQAPDGAVVAAIADRVTWTSLAAGESLFERGDPADAAYLVVGGRVGVVDFGPAGGARDRRSGTSTAPTIDVGRGGIVGEFGLLEDRRRSATVVALRDSTLARLSAADFAALTQDHSALAMGLVRRVLERSGDETSMAAKNRSFALAVTADVTAEQYDEITASMITALQTCGPTAHLTRSSVDRLLQQVDIADTPTGGFGEIRLAELFHQAETDSDHVVADIGSDVRENVAPHWTSRCLHQADHVVIICSPEPDDAEAATIERLLGSTPSGISRWLALLHPATAQRPSGAARMSARFGVDEVHHLRGRSERDLGRLARLAAGRGVGLVLSGGGARGHAHLGVHSVLAEHGVPIDRVIGASMGSIVAGGIGQQLGPAEALEAMRNGADDVLDYTIPLVSLIKGERIVRVLDEQFHGWDVADTWVPFSCISTDLTSAEIVVHRAGPITTAIRTSIAIPGVLPPVAHDGHLLADGGILDNLPAGILADDPSVGVIIASDVAPPQGPTAKSDHGLSVSGWRVARSRFLRRPEQRARRLMNTTLRRDQSTVDPDVVYPGLGTTLLRALLIGSSRSRDEHLAAGIIDLYLEIDVREIPLLDFSQVDKAAEAGRAQAQDAVAAWLDEHGGTPWGLPAAPNPVPAAVVDSRATATSEHDERSACS